MAGGPASSGVSGDFAELRALTQKVASLGQPIVRKMICKAAGEEALTQAQEGFDKSRNPYGVAWPKPQSRERGDVAKAQPLRDTGRLMNSFTFNYDDTGFKVGTNVIYAKVHQYGAVIIPRKAKVLCFQMGGRKVFAKRVRIPQRQMVPEQSTGGPGLWLKPIEEAALDEAKKHLGAV